ncbi:MAG: hypothetical protein ACR2HR_08385 [Euzebya sp.]
MSDHAVDLEAIADRIEQDEDFAMRVGEDARATFEAEGLPDQLIARVLSEAEADVVGFAAMPDDSVALAVKRVAAAARVIARRVA